MLKQIVSQVRSSAAKLTTDQTGNFGIMTALLMPVLLTAGGLAINYAYLSNARTNMGYALDVALTSTTRDVVTNNRSDTAAHTAMTDFLDANAKGGINEGITMVLSDLDIDRTARTIKAKVTSDVKLPFSVFGMAKSWPIAVAAESSYADRPVEVAMMLDVTGSMNDPGTPKNGRKQTKLQNMQEAATQAVKDLLSRNSSGQKPRVRVALVPYSQGVNAGVLSDANYIETRAIPTVPLGLDILNNPQTEAQRAIKVAQDAARRITGMDKCTTERKTSKGAADFGDAAPAEATINRALSFQDAVNQAVQKNWPHPCPNTAVVPLSADKAKLLAAINSFEGGGGTAGHIGVQWTRYVLSPKWGSFLRSKTDSNAVPATPSNNTTSVRKVAILLTDGEFNSAYINGVDSADAARTHCAAMKENIEVFTIGFMLNDSGAKATMAACASPDEPGGVKHYYDASSAEELNAAFRAITTNTEIIRLTN